MGDLAHQVCVWCTSVYSFSTISTCGHAPSTGANR